MRPDGARFFEMPRLLPGHYDVREAVAGTALVVGEKCPDGILGSAGKTIGIAQRAIVVGRMVRTEPDRPFTVADAFGRMSTASQYETAKGQYVGQAGAELDGLSDGGGRLVEP